jgi:opacity protein-like surface antigen
LKPLLTALLFFSLAPTAAFAQQSLQRGADEWSFAVGLKSTFPTESILGVLTNASLSRGAVAECRYGGDTGGFRFRAALDFWGRNPYSEAPQFTSEVMRIRPSVGIMMNFGGLGAADLYWGFDLGADHWDIKSSHPLFGSQSYNKFAFAIGVGAQAERLFLEIYAECHALDNKGIERYYVPTRGFGPELPPNMPLVKSEYPTAGQGLTFALGWKF